eukprot:TRINITY_DN3205_c0_g2_i1.p1 TRINITY_DN3205_c0_g2~~TRINITY_DN3205_c0_g2_i1.p1  ORF type:complete len:147 (-),score=41.25 TRINITY_DN3205_c0_g2_i1:13-453(-)
MNDLKRGIIPRELENESRGREVIVDLMDKQGQKYEAPPPPAMVSFSGSAQSLGGTTTNLAPSTGSTEASVDSTKPTTTIRVRMKSGKSLTLTLNHDHTVADLYAHIKALTGLSELTLRNSFPPKPLNNFDQSLSEANLLNSAIVQA